MTEKSIPIGGDMVCAILDGRKTQRREVMRVQPPDNRYQLCTLLDSTTKADKKNIGKFHWQIVGGGMRVLASDDRYFTPRYQVGDHLWVKETFRHFGNSRCLDGISLIRAHVIYQADNEVRVRHLGEWKNFSTAPKKAWWNTGKCPWTPSIHMPRWASRITLLVKEVSAERLQCITPSDAKAEGDIERSGFPEFHARGALCHVRWFRSLWDSINAKRGYGWDTNPWVWVYKFEHIEEDNND
jgi:hypothetical protein